VARSTQTAYIAAGSVHQASFPEQAWIVSSESPSAMNELHPLLFAKLKPSFIAIASAIIADDRWGIYLQDAAIN
jgi:hypothetical protein